ncbi:polynucleotide adenylyltransferase [Halomonas cupida]|uniref:polynucleotide adenylyltransferase n=1 Tax=Halomonas TaxID=2745 RepID=UPI0021BDA476|nr:polynucleotide adenylyltransferase [Halomonas sp. DP5Y7-2]
MAPEMPGKHHGSTDPCAGLERYRVGGAVRDALLGWPVKDTDWVVVGETPASMRERGFTPVGRDFPVFLHPRTHEEYALARTERKSGHGYTGFEVHASPDVTLEEDLGRRDLTINAMAESLDGHLVDPFNGRRDLQQRRLRHVSQAFVEDPLRVLRTARFLARYAGLGFAIAESTQALMKQLADSGELDHLVAERVWVETEKALGEPEPRRYFEALDSCGALSRLMPGLVQPGAAEFKRACERMSALPPALAGQPVWRWGRLVEALPAEQRRQLEQALKVPNPYRDLGHQLALTRELKAQLADGAGSEEASRIAMTWCDGIDAWRRSERVAPLLSLLAMEMPEQAAWLARGVDQARSLAPRELLDQGFKGAELGQELRRRRLACFHQGGR